MEQDLSKTNSENVQRQMVNDEIDLVQLMLVLFKRKYLILIVFVLCLVVGGAYAFLKPLNYKYTTTLQIGTLMDGEKGQAEKKLIESSDTTLVKIDNVYVPAATGSILEETHRKLLAQAKVQKNSNIILITSNGLSEDQPLFKKFHERIVNPLIEDHQQRIAASKKQYDLLVDKEILALEKLEDPQIYGLDEKVLEVKIDQAKQQLSDYDDQKKLLGSQKKRLLETKKLLQEQIAKIEKTLEMAYVNRPKASDEVSDEAKALTFLMVNNQIDQNENRLAALRERLYVQLENEKQQLENKLAENRRAWELQKNKILEVQSAMTKFRADREAQKKVQKNVIAETQSKVELYQNTQMLGLAVRSIKPEGAGKAIILALSGMLGLMGGIMLAFVAEFMNKVRQQRMTESHDQAQ